jgi:putative ABC transport system substrate-binding protein
MRLRELFLAAAMLVVASPAAAQQQPTAHIGWLAHGDTMPRHFFDEALARLGWIEGKNLTIERRFSGSAGEQADSAAAELVSWRPDVIVALGTVDARPLLALTRAIPIVVVTAGDPVGQGIAASLARPGGNVTGTASVTAELFPKLLELVRELVPEARRISVLGNPPVKADPPASLGASLGLTILNRHASRAEELDAAYATAVSDGDAAMVVQLSPLSYEEWWRVVALAARFKLPSFYPLRDYAEVGGLISYGAVIRDNFERAAALVDKILRGATPADLPIEQPTHFELVLNLNTARALRLTIPPLILARADEVIE